MSEQAHSQEELQMTQPKMLTLVAKDVDTLTEDEFNELMDEINAMYDYLDEEVEDKENETGYCGFPCDGHCPTCGGAGTFDMDGEV